LDYKKILNFSNIFIRIDVILSNIKFIIDLKNSQLKNLTFLKFIWSKWYQLLYLTYIKYNNWIYYKILYNLHMIDIKKDDF
jgi:hypothetical protein